MMRSPREKVQDPDLQSSNTSESIETWPEDSGGNPDRAYHWRSGKKVCWEGWNGHSSQCFSETSPLDIETQRPLVMVERAIMLENRVKGNSKLVKESKERGRKESPL